MLTEERRSKLSRRFSQLDANRDGYQQLWRLLSQHAATDGDGTISLDEFRGSVRDFFYSDDAESVGKYIFAGAS